VQADESYEKATLQEVDSFSIEEKNDWERWKISSRIIIYFGKVLFVKNETGV